MSFAFVYQPAMDALTAAAATLTATGVAITATGVAITATGVAQQSETIRINPIYAKLPPGQHPIMAHHIIPAMGFKKKVQPHVRASVTATNIYSSSDNH